MKQENNTVINFKSLYKWSIAMLYLILITYLSLASSDNFRVSMFNIPHRDKIVHFFMYGFFVVILNWSLNGIEITKSRIFVLILFPAIYGILMEIAQFFLVNLGRSFEVADIIANTSGVLFFWLLLNRKKIFHNKL